MKIWAFCVFMPQKLQDMSSFLGFGGNSALLHQLDKLTKQNKTLQDKLLEVINKISEK